MTDVAIVRRDDLRLILDGLDEHWITYPEHQPAIDRLWQAAHTYDIFDMDLEYLTTITIQKPGSQAIVNALVELGYDPIRTAWECAATISDGFGSTWSAYCPECGKKTMQVVRPGSVQCSNCGGKR